MVADGGLIIVVVPCFLIMAVCAYEVYYLEKVMACRRRNKSKKVCPYSIDKTHVVLFVVSFNLIHFFLKFLKFKFKTFTPLSLFFKRSNLTI